MLESGVLLSGRYRLDERVATGGMGDVWRGTDVVLGRRVAVKVLLPSLLADPDFIARFRAEARMLATLHHPGIVQVFDYGEDELPTGRTDYLVMEYVDGEPLSARIRDTGRLGVVDAMHVVAQVAQALHAAHQGGIVHRDVKPSNLLVQADGTVRLLDFGVARSVNITSITSSNAVPGTALYMAPEQAAGKPVSAATDIYALGAVAYQCVAGQPPFSGENPLQVAVKHLHEDPDPLPADVPAPVAELIGRALAKDPADRYPDAAAMATAARAAAIHPEVVAADAAGGVDGGGIAPAPSPTAVTGLGVRAAAGGAGRAGGAGAASGPSTLTDNPVVGSGGRDREPGIGILTLAGIAAVVGLGAAVVTAVIALKMADDAPATNAPPSPTPSSSATVEAHIPDQPSATVPDGQETNPDRPRDTPRPRPTTSPKPSPTPDSEPTEEPTESTPPTNPPPTNPPTGPENPPGSGGPVEPGNG
ncbi:serine/threonine-protein kinase [Plantactinospora sp. BB1]|uniref:serine/threonine-protein kinase n=1 Tax=Plantactinospora sp. BB1 TaxID=2071627 RepID=UPI000D15C6FE|nr:serine/threonine-protein kinase [Plantactinospora sp. BB1]AVT41078.1 serine/threonine protein kinase [Plantactinospora sp. BB1]